MNQSVTYRQNAAECYEAARIFSDPRQKAKLLAMAQHRYHWPNPPSETAILIASTKPHHGARAFSIRGTGGWHYSAPLLLRASRQSFAAGKSPIEMSNS